MHSAMQKALRRYPYFVFRIIKTDSGYDKVENQLPVVVMDSFDKEIVLGSEEVNYHWIAAACEGKELKLIMSHMIADGRSAMRFYKTLLYCYFTEKTGNRLDPYGILLPDSGISPDEDVKVYGIMDGEDNTRRNTVEDPFMIPDAVEDPMKAYFYKLTVSEKEFLSYSKDSNNSPLTLTTVFMAKMFQDVYPDNEKTIYAGVGIDARDALNCPESRFTNVYVIFVKHSPSDLDQGLKDLGTMTRGQIDVQSEKEIVRYVYNSVIRISGQIQSSTDPMEKQRLSYEIYKLVTSNPAYAISYVGKPEWGSLEPFIDEEYTIIFGDKLQLELNAAGGKFCISWVQGFENDAYVRNFRDLLQKNGIRCVVSGPFLQVRPKCCLP